MLAKNEIDWTHEWREQGLQQGLQQGQRDLLLHLVRSRFGDETASTLTPILEDITETETLTNIGEWIVTIDNEDTFIAKVKSLQNSNLSQ